MNARRLVAVLGYSDGATVGLHAICAARLERAAEIAEPEDAVLFSGWARRSGDRAEAELMARAWSLPVRRIVCDPSARSTAGNAAAIARAARALDVDHVVVVTSSWHARRALVLVRAALARSGTKVTVATTVDRGGAAARLRELACWSLVPVLAVAGRRAKVPSGA